MTETETPPTVLVSSRLPDGGLELSQEAAVFVQDAVHHALHQLAALEAMPLPDNLSSAREIEVLKRALNVLGAPSGPSVPLNDL